MRQGKRIVQHPVQRVASSSSAAIALHAPMAADMPYVVGSIVDYLLRYGRLRAHCVDCYY